LQLHHTIERESLFFLPPVKPQENAGHGFVETSADPTRTISPQRAYTPSLNGRSQLIPLTRPFETRVTARGCPSKNLLAHPAAINSDQGIAHSPQQPHSGSQEQS